MSILCKNLEFSYDKKPLIKNLNPSVKKGEHIWIRGKSGSGKSSLLQIIAGILPLKSGTVQIQEQNFSTLSQEQIKKIRLNCIGFLHQENHLITHWTVQQNLDLVDADPNRQIELLQKLGLDLPIIKKLASQLSGGERQRVCLARLLLQRPKIALLDEPLSHLDDANADLALSEIAKNLAASTVLVVSHDHRISSYNFKPIQFDEINL